ncbi:MAG: T9SS type A sorting domain-containing protein [Saprospiraceae bacterium]|nr:T9SS type A sorting domain-containing protein [Saprospiraceae bacterium]
MVNLQIDACGAETITAQHAGGQTLDANDALQYVLHTSAGPVLGVVLAESTTPTFAFPPLGIYGQTYYISAIVGNDLGGGDVDLFDPCLSVSIGTPVTWHEIPTVTLVEQTVEACPGELIWFTINYTGEGPWTYQLTANGELFGPSQTSSVNSFTGNFGGPDTMVVCLANTSNAYCTGTVSGCVTANISELPTCEISVTTDPDCDGFPNGTITLDCTGANGPVSYTWSNGETTPNLQNLTGGNYSVTVSNAEGCTRTYNTIVNYGVPLSANILLFDSISCFDQSGALVSLVGGGTPPYTYLWTGPNGFTYTANHPYIKLPGTYTLLVTDAVGCTAQTSITVQNTSDDCGTIVGNVTTESDGNCILDSGENGLRNWMVRATAANGDEYFGTTDSLGHYEIRILGGDYLVEAIPFAGLWDACTAPISITSSGVSDLDTADFHFHEIYNCPLMEVDISTPFLRRCFPNTYFVQYCNHGTETALDATIAVTLDSLIHLQGAQIPYTGPLNGIYTFEIGDVAPGECGSFYINTEVLCDAVLGQTLCAEAHIYPDSLCGPPNGNWSGAFVDITSDCNADSVVFTLTNTGTGDMPGPSSFIVVQDGVMLMSQTFELGVGESTTASYAATGATYVILAEQVPDAPGLSYPTLFVEGCGGNGAFSLGYASQFPENDADPFLSIDCQAVIGSFDPNDKQGYPLGFGPNNLIEEGQSIDYLIRFQNTGTDTAFKVVVKDVIHPNLDIATLRPGASSHPYQLDIHRDSLIFTFDNILLPDSFVNEPASHGFVKFSIGQKAGLNIGDAIENEAAIYFDFNDPVITNRTRHQVGEPFIVNSVEPPVLRSKISCTVYPNPMGEEAVVLIQGAENQDFELRLYDMTGRYLRSEKITGGMGKIRKNGLPDGLYFFDVLSEGVKLGQGKVAME